MSATYAPRSVRRSREFVSDRDRYRHEESQRFTKIYVKNLDEEYDTEDAVWSLFELYGNVTDVRLVRDSSGRPLGVAYVTYEEHFMALNACKALHRLTNKLGQPMYVERAHTRTDKLERAEQRETVGTYRVYVKNLNDRVDDKVLFDTFSRYGTILAYKVFLNELGDSLCYGFVSYLTEEAALRAITRAHGTRLYGDQISVGKLIRLSQLQPPSVYGRKIFIKGITMPKLLRKIFRVYGCIEELEVMGNKCFLTFTDKTMALKALADSPIALSKRFGGEIFVKMAAPEPRDDRHPKHIPVQVFECDICQTIQSIANQVGFGCEHQLCWDCAKNYLETNIIAGNVNDLKCVRGHCQHKVDHRFLPLIVSESVLKTYKQWMGKK